jgi:hypothetical protein
MVSILLLLVANKEKGSGPFSHTWKKMIVTKLDRRHTGNHYFAYYVTPNASSTIYQHIVIFHDWRLWCWETFGPSGERDAMIKIKSQTAQWAWDTEFHHLRLYFKEDAFTLFKLKWA